MKKYETPQIVGIAVETELNLLVGSSHFVPRETHCRDCADKGKPICKDCLYRNEQDYFRS